MASATSGPTRCATRTKDETALDLVMLVSDGLYFNNALSGGAIPGPVPRGSAMDALVDLVERAARG
ncbi:hypothetical protein [Microbacterium sp. 4R-513]|uniref:hypothetical protein n=1 Tax=Microbacterium sp. 4R-513 TaxID=2567934 RepID=UPI001F493A15|nr:hypothetical protein [Microbacterium sp. 4R-513]